METIDITIDCRVPPNHLLAGFASQFARWAAAFNALNSTVEIVNGRLVMTAYFSGDTDDAARFAASMREHGLTQPLNVYHKPGVN